jgi:predicted nucleic acid-binding protein
MILVDTSVWIDHFRRDVPGLRTILENDRVLTHPFIRGELACGNLRNRNVVLNLMAELPVAPVATDEEALHLIEHWDLMGRGIGFIDVHLVASVMLADAAQLWTRDKRLAAIAAEVKIAFLE